MPKPKTFDELLADCKQDFISHNFKEKYFPLEPIAPDEDKWEVCEYHFKTKITGQDAFRELRKMGYRLLDGSRRAMEYMAAKRNINIEYSLIITACWQFPDHQWYAPVFHQGGGIRYVETVNLDRSKRFGPSFGWLVLRKKTP